MFRKTVFQTCGCLDSEGTVVALYDGGVLDFGVSGAVVPSINLTDEVHASDDFRRADREMAPLFFSPSVLSREVKHKDISRRIRCYSLGGLKQNLPKRKFMTNIFSQSGELSGCKTHKGPIDKELVRLASKKKGSFSNSEKEPGFFRYQRVRLR